MSRQARTRREARERRAQRRLRTPEQLASDQRRLHPKGMKYCPGCGRTLQLWMFDLDLGRSDGLRQRCKPCRTRRLAEREQTARLADHVACEAMEAMND